MSIETGGSRLDRYTELPTTPLLQADPEAVNKGILSAYKVANEAEKFNAFKAVNNELNALRADREAAAHAKLQNEAGIAQAAMALRPLQTSNALVGLDTESKRLPMQGQYDLTALSNKLGNQPTEIQMTNAELANRSATQPLALQITNDTQAAEGVKAGAALDRVESTVATDNATAEYNAADAVNKLQEQADRQKLAADALADQLAHAKTDAEQRRLKAQLDIETQKSVIAENNAKAARDLAYAQNGAPPAQVSQELRAYQTSEKDILERPLPSQVKMKVYLENKAKDPLMTPDPEGERLIVQLRGLRAAQGQALEAIAANVDKRAQRLAEAKAPKPVEVHFNPVGAISTPAAQGVFDTPATEAGPQVKYDEQGNAWTRDANGNVVPYKP